MPQAAIRFGFIRSWRALTRELPGNTRSSAAVTTALKEPRIAGRASHPSANRSPVRVPGLYTEMIFLTATGHPLLTPRELAPDPTLLLCREPDMSTLR